jgi:hypothetical protein
MRLETKAESRFAGGGTERFMNTAEPPGKSNTGII